MRFEGRRCRMLLGAELSGEGIAVARVAGFGLFSLAVACWPGRCVGNPLRAHPDAFPSDGTPVSLHGVLSFTSWGLQFHLNERQFHFKRSPTLDQPTSKDGLLRAPACTQIG